MEKVICNYFDNLCLMHKHFYATMPDMDYGLGPWTLWNCGISHLDIISSIKIRLAGLINKKQKQKLDPQSDAFSKQISF